MTTYYNEAAFFDAWRTGVELAGPRFFGDGTHSPATAASKWDLTPDVEYISNSIGVLSSGEQVFLASLVSLYSSDLGGQLLADIGVHGLADISAALDKPRVEVLAALLLAYPGW
ncbi:hypothetical protein BTO20_37955 (plasmid) [Mycobacterium dioxanotrophicus]|jgi:hypothetical protein|uniref:Uncharacterized protein n=1 Tax=Mycobacterium dioxanotrophicus TaxID=482462 RepID=A0A1Y0CHL0_9MYCO|nr:hypothetical protein [Mycobacterium dioxanotrophicus]ART74405.1 hypothetical protein BTO20_37955 [Mycobacterium dioxanotrophicus]